MGARGTGPEHTPSRSSRSSPPPPPRPAAPSSSRCTTPRSASPCPPEYRSRAEPFAVDNASLTRFFTLHFLLPFIIAALRVLHLFFPHQTGSRNPLGVSSDSDKIKFNPYFSWKDLVGAVAFFQVIIAISLLTPGY